MYNYKLTIQYDGTKYNGWQRQGNTNQTIQGKLNEIIGKYIGEDCNEKAQTYMFDNGTNDVMVLWTDSPKQYEIKTDKKYIFDGGKLKEI